MLDRSTSPDKAGSAAGIERKLAAGIEAGPARPEDRVALGARGDDGARGFFGASRLNCAANINYP